MVLCSCGSQHPPGPHTARNRMPTARRRRFGVDAAVSLTVHWRERRVKDPRAWLSDISQSGVFVKTRSRPRRGQTVLLQFVCGSQSCVCSGVVASVRPGHGFAMEITGANGAYDALVTELERVRPTVSRDVLALIGDVQLTVV